MKPFENLRGKHERDFIGNPKKMKRERWVIAVVLILAAGVLLRYYQNDKTFQGFFDFDKGLKDFVVTIVIGAFGSLVASVIFMRLFESEQTKINAIAGLSEISFLNEFFNDLRYFGGRTCAKYIVSVQFLPIADAKDQLLVKINYRYEKRLTSRKLNFVIDRIRGDNGTHYTGDAYFLHECYFALVERGPKNQTDESLYSVRHLVVNSGGSVVLNRSVGNNGDCVEFDAILPDDVPLDEPVTIAYDVTFPLEIESQLAINFEFPTRGMEVILDYAPFADRIEVISQSFISARFGPNEIKRSDSKSKIHLSYASWLLPKNGVAFCWWKKESATNAE